MLPCKSRCDASISLLARCSDQRYRLWLGGQLWIPCHGTVSCTVVCKTYGDSSLVKRCFCCPRWACLFGHSPPHGSCERMRPCNYCYGTKVTMIPRRKLVKQMTSCIHFLWYGGAFLRLMTKKAMKKMLINKTQLYMIREPMP